MSDAPKRRGRPPKRLQHAALAAAEGDPNAFVAVAEVPPRPEPMRLPIIMAWGDTPMPTVRLRVKAGTVQQAFRHPTGTEWRPLPVVPESAPDWEDA